MPVMSSVAEAGRPKFEEMFSSLPPKRQKAPETLALRNALRLYYDAHQVSKHGSYQTAISLYILSMEELAKFISLAFDHQFDDSVKNLHVRKHKGIATFFVAICWVLSVLEYFGGTFVYKEKKFHVDTNGDTERFDKIETYTRYYEYVDGRGDDRHILDLDEFKAIMKVGNYTKALRFFSMYYGNELNDLKNKGLYLDLQDGKVKSSPYDIDEAMLKNMQELCDGVLETIKALIR